MRGCLLFFLCFPHEIDKVCAMLVDSVHKNYITSSAQITLVTVVTGFGSAMEAQKQGTRVRRKSGTITCVKKARGIQREVSRKLWRSTAFAVLLGTWKGLGSPWALHYKKRDYLVLAKLSGYL